MVGEDVIETVTGRFGKYQIWILFLITIGRLPTDFQLSNVVFILPNVDYVCTDESAFNQTNYCPCNNPVYDQSTIHSSVTSTWNLICDRSQLASLAQSFLQVGILAGGLLFGFISDRYGRKIACLLSLMFEVTFVALSAAATELWMFIVFRFLIGTSVGGTLLCTYILIIELSGMSFRPYLTGLTEIAYVLTYLTLPGIAYFIRDWRYLQLSISVPWIFVVFYYFLIPESPRWLITIGRKAEAIKLLTYMAKKNGRPTANISAVVDKAYEETTSSHEKYGTYLDLFKTTKIRKFTIIVAFVWMCCSLTFYGINQYIGRLQGNLYLNVMLSAASLIPGLILVVLASLYLKRKIALMMSFSLAGISLLLFNIIPKNMDSAILSLAIIGQIGAYTAFVQIYLYSAELFPTVIRNSALGFASVFARFGGFIAPFVVNIGIEWVSIVIFSILAFSAALLCFILPNTNDIVLLNTIEQTEEDKKENVQQK